MDTFSTSPRFFINLRESHDRDRHANTQDAVRSHVSEDYNQAIHLHIYPCNYLVGRFLGYFL